MPFNKIRNILSCGPQRETEGEGGREKHTERERETGPSGTTLNTQLWIIFLICQLQLWLCSYKFCWHSSYGTVWPWHSGCHQPLPPERWLVYSGLPIQQPCPVISSHLDAALHHQGLLATLVLQSAASSHSAVRNNYHSPAEALLPLCGWESVCGSVCVHHYGHVSTSVWDEKGIWGHDENNGPHEHSLGVQHAWTDDELEDVLQSFQGPQDGLTLFTSTGHIQISLQHWHQLSAREREQWGENRNQTRRIKIFGLYTSLER